MIKVTGGMVLVNLISNIFDVELLKNIEDAIKEVYQLEVKKDFKNLELNFAYNKNRNQYDAFKILTHYRYLLNPNEIILFIIDNDIYVSYLNFCFGLSYGKMAIISTFRLKETFYGRKENLSIYYLRCKKEAVHEIGHSLGLTHCNNFKCVMFFSNSIEDTDKKDYKLCDKCKKILKI